jgi:mannose-6-phosphate isomerase-like protein (cupin superfamily)
MGVEFFTIEELKKQREGGAPGYLEFLRVAAMSAGVYAVKAGAEDTQTPHDQDEIYYVVEGTSGFRFEGEEGAVDERDVAPGSVIFVPARATHSFFDIREDLLVLAFFAPAETQG